MIPGTGACIALKELWDSTVDSSKRQLGSQASSSTSAQGLSRPGPRGRALLLQRALDWALRLRKRYKWLWWLEEEMEVIIAWLTCTVLNNWLMSSVFWQCSKRKGLTVVKTTSGAQLLLSNEQLLEVCSFTVTYSFLPSHSEEGWSCGWQLGSKIL